MFSRQLFYFATTVFVVAVLMNGGEGVLNDITDAFKGGWNDMTESMLESFDSVKGFFKEKYKKAEDLMGTSDEAELKKKAKATLTLLEGLKEDREDYKEDEDTTEAQKAALDRLETNIMSLQDVKAKIDGTDHTEAQKKEEWNKTMIGMKADMNEYIALAGAGAIAASLFIVLAGLAIAYAN